MTRQESPPSSSPTSQASSELVHANEPPVYTTPSDAATSSSPSGQVDSPPATQLSSIRKILKWLIHQWSWVTLAGLVILILLGLVMPGCYTTRRLKHNAITILDDKVSIGITYPAELFLGDEPSELRISVWYTGLSTFTQTVTLRFDFPEGIIVSGTQSTINDRVALVTFPPSVNPPTASLFLSNAGLGFPTTKLTHIYGKDSSPVPGDNVISFELESSGQAAWRRFWTNAISENGPALLAIGLVISALSVALPYFQTVQVRQEHRLDEEALELASKIRDHLRNANGLGAQSIWNLTAERGLSSRLVAGELDRLKELVDLSQNGFTDSEKLERVINNSLDETVDETVGAIVCAITKTISLHSEVPEKCRELLGKVQITRIKNAVRRDKFIRAWSSVQGPLEYRAQKLTPTEDWTEPTLVSNWAFPDPLRQELAEHEDTSLYESKAFWPKHPKSASISPARHNQVIYGLDGCGRTALAKYIYYKQPGGFKDFFVYLAVDQHNSDPLFILRNAIARQLLEYIQAKPTLLYHLLEDQRRLLANILAEPLTQLEVAAKAQLETDNADPPNDKGFDYRRRVGQSQLELLTQAIHDYPTVPTVRDEQWLSSVQTCCQTLRFSGIRLLLDFQSETSIAARSLLPILLPWQWHNIITTSFMPKSTYEALYNELGPNPFRVETVELLWDKNQLKELMDHRFKAVASHDVAKCFSDGTLDKFLDDLRTPRQIVQLWQKILQRLDPRAEQITVDDVHRARNW